MLAAASGTDAHRRLESWDAQWYAGIAAQGYGFVRLQPDGRVLSDYAFFPLYPMLERLVAQLSGLAYADAGLVVSGLASVAAAWGIFAIGDLLSGRRVAVILTVAWAALPIGIVQSMAYSESLFTALAAWALMAVLRDRWLTAGMLACLAGATRPTGLAVAVAVAVSAFYAVRRGRPVRPLAAAALAPLGWLCYVAWVGLRTGSPLGYFHVTAQWGNTFDGGAAFAHWTWALVMGPAAGSGGLVILGVGVVLALLGLCVNGRAPLPLVAFAGSVAFLALTTSGYFGSKPRYLLPAFPLLLPVAVALARRRTAVVAMVLCAATAVSAVYGSVWLLGPGPP